MRAKTLDSNSHSAETSTGSAKHEAQELARMLRDSALEVAWRQWRALGASAALKSHSSRHLQSLIDPEALVLFSLLRIEDERRLADLIRDWMVLNSDLLSVQRVKNLANDYGKDVRGKLAPRLEWVAGLAVEKGKDFRWRSLVALPHSRLSGVHGAHPLGFTTRNSKISHATAGSKTRAVRARLTEPSALFLRLRLGLGVGVKADVIGFLLGKGEEWATVREIAEATAYSRVSVRRAVDDLAAARLVLALEAQPAGYRAERRTWASLLQIEGTPVWQNWHQRFTFVSAFMAWVDALEKRPLSAYAFGAQGRELLEQHRRAFEHNRIAVWSMHTDVPDWGMFVRHAVQSLASSMVKWA
ncbi:MAG: MarR family transcriptional regulator [Gemmatimonadota bacterium]|nr:MarR family transcriptional regulator [Gemmatimonadota bacterium]